MRTRQNLPGKFPRFQWELVNLALVTTIDSAEAGCWDYLSKSENDPVATGPQKSASSRRGRNIGSSASSVLGKWTAIVHWGDKPPFPPSALVFNKDGSFNWEDGSGWWIQNEGLLFLFFPDSYPPGLIYTANVTSDTLVGVMGYACDANKYGKYPTVPPPGVWWATRRAATAKKAAAKKTTKRRKKK